MIGFLLWLGLLLGSGFAVGVALGISKGESLVLRIGAAFGLGLCTNVVFQVAESFYLIHGLGFDSLVPIVSLTLGLLCFAVIRNGLPSHGAKGVRLRPSWFAFLFFSLALMVAIYFLANPYFPDLPSVDFTAHVRNLVSLLRAYPAFQGSILYWGFYYVVAPLGLLEPAPFLYLGREAIGVLIVLSLFLVHRCAFDITNDERAALVADAVYVFGGFVWFVDGFDVGLWPNFFGLMASLFMVSATVRFFAKRGGVPCLIVVVLLAFGNLLFSHYSSLLVIPALLIFGLSHIRSDFRSAAIFSSLLLLPLSAGYAASPGMMQTLLGFTSGGGSISPPSPTWLSWVFADSATKATAAVPASYPLVSIPMPAISYIIAIMSDDFASFIILLVSLPVFIIHALWKSKSKAHLSIPLVWFLACIAAAPFNPSAWRFSVVALMPLTILAACSLVSLVPFHRVMLKSRKSDIRPTVYGKALIGISMLMLVVPLSATSTGSWSFINVSRSARTPFVIPQDQAAIVQTFFWMDSKCANCTFVSVAEWRFSLSDVQGGPTVYYAPKDNVLWGDPSQLQLYAVAHNARFLIVTKYTSEPRVPETNVTLLADRSYAALIQKTDDYIRQLNSSVNFGTLSAFPVQFNGTFYTQQVAVFFEPFSTYTKATLPYLNVVYENSGLVKIICIASSCHDWKEVISN